MHIGVIGMGAIGGTFAGMLAHHGFDVDGTARGVGLAALQTEPLHVSGGWGTFSASMHVAPTLERPVDLAIVTTKAQDAAAALTENRMAIGDAPVIVVQNGLEGIHTAVSVLGRTDHVYGGSSSLAAAYLTAGSVHVNVPAVTRIGAGPGAPTSEVAALAERLSTALPVLAVENFDGVLWTKLIVNHVNAFPAMTGLSVQDAIADDGLCQILTASMRETVAIATRMRVHFEPVQALTHAMLTTLLYEPLTTSLDIPRLLASNMGSEPNRGSTLQSILRHQPTEIDWINGAVLNVARQLGIEAPINAKIVAMVRAIEDGRAFYSSDAVITAFSPLLARH